MAGDDDLLAAARADPDAFARAFEAYRLPVYRYLRTRTASDDEAADLVGVTFERALRAIRTYRSSGSAIGWLLRIARNAAIDAFRKGQPTLSLQAVETERQSALDPPPEVAYLAIERLRELRAQVHALPEPTRDAIALRYGAGLPTREIATVIGKSEAATQKLISRGLAALKEARRAER